MRDLWRLKLLQNISAATLHQKEKKKRSLTILVNHYRVRTRVRLDKVKWAGDRFQKWSLYPPGNQPTGHLNESGVGPQLEVW